MAITNIVNPSNNSLFNSPIPLKLVDSEVNDYKVYNYNTLMVDDATTALTITNTTNGIQIITDVSNYNLDDSVYITYTDDGNTKEYISQISNITTTAIFMEGFIAFDGVVSDVNIYKIESEFINKPKPSDNSLELNLSDSLMNKVTTVFSPLNEIREASETRYDYNLRIGRTTNVELPFDNVIEHDGNFALVYSSTTVSDIQKDINVGDFINITENEVSWTYDGVDTSNLQSDGYIAYTNSLAIDCYIDVQRLYGTNEYDGTPSTVLNDADVNNIHNGYTEIDFGYNFLLTNEFPLWQLIKRTPYNSQTLAIVNSGGTMYGVAHKALHKTTQEVKDLVQSGSNVYVVTNVTAYNTDVTVTGEVTKDSLTTVYNNDSLNDLRVYYGQQDLWNYDKDYFDDYVATSAPDNANVSSIYDFSSNTYEVDYDTPQWLLYHSTLDVSKNIIYQIYNGGLVAELSASTSFEDFYIPTTIPQWEEMISNGDASLISGTIPANKDVTVVISVFDNTVNSLFKQASFIFKGVCSHYNKKTLIWRDNYGSYVSFPFNLINKENLEIGRNTYQKGRYGFNSSGFELNTYDKGDVSYINNTKELWELNSDWVNDLESEVIKDLISSTDVYIQDEDGTIRSVILVENNKEIKHTNNINLINYNIKLALGLKGNRK